MLLYLEVLCTLQVTLPPSRCVGFFLCGCRPGPRPGRRTGVLQAAGGTGPASGGGWGGASRGVRGGPRGVTWRAAEAEEAEVAAHALWGVRGKECPEPGRRAAARGTPKPGPAAGARPGGWPGQKGAHVGARGPVLGQLAPGGLRPRGNLRRGAAGTGRGGSAVWVPARGAGGPGGEGRSPGRAADHFLTRGRRHLAGRCPRAAPALNGNPEEATRRALAFEAPVAAGSCEGSGRVSDHLCPGLADSARRRGPRHFPLLHRWLPGGWVAA